MRRAILSTTLFIALGAAALLIAHADSKPVASAALQLPAQAAQLQAAR